MYLKQNQTISCDFFKNGKIKKNYHITYTTYILEFIFEVYKKLL